MSKTDTLTALELAPEQVAVTPMSMLQMAVSQGADIDKLAKLMDLHERWEAAQAKKQFVAAMAAFKTSAITIVRDKENKQYGSRYVSLGNLVSTVTPFLSRNGLSARWDIEQQSGAIKVTCVVTHSGGHSESVSMTCPPDASGAKNPIQQIKSAVTYAKACTFESICGLAATDANADDDGNGAGKRLAESEVVEKLDWIREAPDMGELQRIFGNAYKWAQEAGDRDAMQAIIAAKEERKKALRAGN